MLQRRIFSDRSRISLTSANAEDSHKIIIELQLTGKSRLILKIKKCQLLWCHFENNIFGMFETVKESSYNFVF